MRAGSRIHETHATNSSIGRTESVPVLQNTRCTLLHRPTRPPTNRTLYDCAFTDEPHVDVLPFGSFYHVTHYLCLNLHLHFTKVAEMDVRDADRASERNSADHPWAASGLYITLVFKKKKEKKESKRTGPI